MTCEPMSSFAMNAKSAKSCDGAQNVGPLGSTTGCPVSPVIAATSSWQPLSISGNSATGALGATGAKSCPPCNGKCREGRDCPAREYASETDAERAAYLIVTAVLWGLSGWAFLAACWAAAGLIAG